MRVNARHAQRGAWLMKRKLMLVLLALPLLGGCIVYPDGYHRGYYWHDRDHGWRDHDRW
jgi:hypothetical protein